MPVTLSAAQDRFVRRARPFAALRVTGLDLLLVRSCQVHLNHALFIMSMANSGCILKQKYAKKALFR